MAGRSSFASTGGFDLMIAHAMLRTLESYRQRTLAFNRRGLAIAASLIAAIVVPARTVAQEMEVPVSVQIPLSLKVITFDRQLHSRNPTEFVVAVVYQSGNRASASARDDAVRAIESAHATVAGAPVRVVEIDLDQASLTAALKARQISLLYVAPLRAIDISELAATARAAGLTTVSGVPHYIALGLAVGVRLQRDRPRILVNLQGARLEGADFTAELLKLAEMM